MQGANMCDSNHDGVRCPGERKHTIRGKDFLTCGSMFFGINPHIECDIIIQCRICKNYFRVVCDGKGDVRIEEMPNGKNIKFNSRG